MVLPALRALERFVFPNTCVACDGSVPRDRPDALLCGLCTSRMRTVTAGCARCGQPLPPVGPCRFCVDWTSLAWARSAVWLGPEARAVTHHLKYGGYSALAESAADVMARAIPRPDGGILVPVPLGAKRLRRRGYNQAERLAAALGRRWGLAVRPDLLRRTRETVTQTALKPEARTANVAGAFEAPQAPTGPARPDERPIILVDDVLTTGATLTASAAACVAAGWTRVGAVTFTRALPYELRAAR